VAPPVVDGVLIEMSHAGPRHARVVERLTWHFVVGGAERFGARIQDCLLTTDGGLRSPDLMVLELIGTDRLPEPALIVIG
jgi:hypothetical protein